MLHYYILILSAIGLIERVYCIDFFQCENVQSMECFDKDKFSGVWYAVEGSQYYSKMDCLKYVVRSNETSYDLDITANWIDNDRKREQNISLIFNSQDINYVSSTLSEIPDVFKIWVLYTDYENSAVVYACIRKTLTDGEHRYVFLTRDQHPHIAVLSLLSAKVSSHFPPEGSYIIKQGNCTAK